MSEETPTTILAKKPAAVRPAVGTGRRLMSWLLVTGYVGVVVIYLAVPVPEGARAGFGHAAMVAGALVAVAACVWAARRGPPGSRPAWWCFASAAGVAALGHGIWAVQQLVLGRTITFGSAPFYFVLLFHPFFAAGAAVALRPAKRRGVAEITLDGGLIVMAALMVVTRFILEPVLNGPPLPRDTLLVLIVAQLGAVSTCLSAGLLVLWGDPVLPGRAVPALAGTAASLLAVTVLTAAGADPSPRSPGDAFDLIWLSAWLTLAAAGVAGARGEADLDMEAAADRIRRRLRRAVAPGAALFLGAGALDAALYPGSLRQVGPAALALAILLMVRIRYAVGEAERRADEGVQLAHTRAMVELSRALAGATELSRTLDLITRWACRLLDARAAGIELLTPDGTTLELRAAYGLPDHVIGMRFPVEGSFTGWVVRERRPRATADPSADPFIRPESAAFLNAKPTAAAPLHFGDRTLGAIFATNRDRPFGPGDLELLGSLADQAALAIENAQLFEQVHALSLTDPLTGLANRRQLERDLAREFAAAQRGRRLILVLFDLDGFKEYNDRHGHLAGDEVLRAFGQILTFETRAMNLAARYGGDEFLVLLTEADPDGARAFVERVARRFHEAVEQLGRSRLTVSAGIAAYRPDMTSPYELVAEADRVLYEVKGDRPPRSSP